MKRREMISAMVAALLMYSSGCVVAERPGRGTYYYYPDDEVYYALREGRYYWYERGDWRYDRKPPPRFVLRDRDRVRIDSDHEPYKDHDKYRKSYPPRRRDRDERSDDKRDDRR